MELTNDPLSFLRETHFITVLRYGMLLALAVLFLQSGIDKLTDFKGNLSWLKGHFAKSPLRNAVPFLLVTLMLLELTAGLTSSLGILMLAGKNDLILAKAGTALSFFTLICLFAGQRIAKDYPGAASLMGYMAFTVLAMFAMLG